VTQVVIRQIVVHYIKRISFYLEEALRFCIRPSRCPSVYAREHKAVGDRFGAVVYLGFTGDCPGLVDTGRECSAGDEVRAGIFERDDGAIRPSQESSVESISGTVAANNETALVDVTNTGWCARDAEECDSPAGVSQECIVDVIVPGVTAGNLAGIVVCRALFSS
jgi:hypothetical protein